MKLKAEHHQVDTWFIHDPKYRHYQENRLLSLEHLLAMYKSDI